MCFRLCLIIGLCFFLGSVRTYSAINRHNEPTFNLPRSSSLSLHNTTEFLIFFTQQREVKLVRMTLDSQPRINSRFSSYPGRTLPESLQPSLDSPRPTSLERRTKSLFGLYPRSPIRNMLTYPERTVGHLGDHCTATLVGPRHALTAAHCVFNKETRQFNHQLDFAPAKVGHREPLGSYRPVKIFIPKAYVEHGDTQSDYALLIFEIELGEELGWVGYGPPAPQDSVGRIIGYPDDKSFATPWSSQCPLSFRDRTVVHQCDTTQGMSGAAILVQSRLDREPFMIGIHTHGGVDFNGGKKIDHQLFNLITFWFEYDYLQTDVDSISDYAHQPQTTSVLEFKNSCAQPLSVSSIWGNNLDQRSQLLLPGETQVAYEFNSLQSFKILASTVDGNPSFHWRNPLPCSSSERSCFQTVERDELKMISPFQYRFEFECSSVSSETRERLDI